MFKEYLSEFLSLHENTKNPTDLRNEVSEKGENKRNRAFVLK